MNKPCLIAILLAGIFLGAFSQEDINCKNFVSKPGVDLSIVLGLTAKQKEEFKKVKTDNYTKDSSYFARLEELRIELFYESIKENADTNQINKISIEIGKVHSELAVGLSAHIKEVKRILNDKQFEKFICYCNDRNEKMRRIFVQKNR